MKSLDLFLPRIVPSTLGVADPLAKQVLVDAAIDFCTRTNAVWADFVVDVVAGQPEYDLDVPASGELLRLLGVWYGNNTRVNLNDSFAVDDPLAIRGAVAGYEPDSGAPRATYALHGTNTLKIYPIPDDTASGMLTVRASYRPTVAATQLDDLLYTKYLDALRYGTLMRLHELPGQGFTSAEASDRSGRRYEQLVGRASSEARKGAAQTSSRVKSRAFA